MIEMDQKEHAQSTVTDEVLHLVRLFNGFSVGDRLLYKGKECYNITGARLITERR